LLAARLFISAEETGAAYTHYQSQYFLEDLFTFFPGEVMMDCGGYTGDTTLEFIQKHSDFKRIHLFEASPSVMHRTKEALKSFCIDDSVVLHENAVGSTNRYVSFCEGNEKGDGKVDTASDEMQTVQEVRIDDISEEYVSIIKMDIEGYERHALTGATKTIQRDTPKLMISLYHCADDFWQLPILIESINPCYKFYIRHVRKFQFYSTVLYCVPSCDHKFLPDSATKQQQQDRLEKINSFCMIPTEEDEGANFNEYYEYLLYLVRTCSVYKHAIEQHTTDIAVLNSALLQRSTDVATLEAALNQRSTDVTTLENALKQRGADVTTLENTLHQSLVENSVITRELNDSRNRVQMLEQRLNRIESTWLYRLAVKMFRIYYFIFRKK